MITGLYLLQKTQRTANEPGELLKPVSSRCHSGLRIMEAQAEGREQILPSRSSDQNTARPPAAGTSGVWEAAPGPCFRWVLGKDKKKGNPTPASSGQGLLSLGVALGEGTGQERGQTHGCP